MIKGHNITKWQPTEPLVMIKALNDPRCNDNVLNDPWSFWSRGLDEPLLFSGDFWLSCVSHGNGSIRVVVLVSILCLVGVILSLLFGEVLPEQTQGGQQGKTTHGEKGWNQTGRLWVSGTSGLFKDRISTQFHISCFSRPFLGPVTLTGVVLGPVWGPLH